MSRILIIEDEASIRRVLVKILTEENDQYQVSEAENGLMGTEMIKKDDFDLVLCDIKMPKMDGVEVLEAVKKIKPEIPMVMISGHGDLETAVESIRIGAFDYISKPPDLNRLLNSVRSALLNNNFIKKGKVKSNKSNEYNIIGESHPILEINAMINKVALTNAKVLIQGPNGSGKELVAHQIHMNSLRNFAPFIEVNCAAIPSELIESELFGHVKGAFTSAVKDKAGKFEAANGGTIFLDEIGDMSMSAQSKVLRALQEHKIQRVGSERDLIVDVRVIAATNKKLRSEIENNNFREDLFHRLAVIEVNVPSLNDRVSDIPLLVEHFLKDISKDSGADIKTMDKEAVNKLKEFTWSGNVRELRNVIERLIILSDKNKITKNDVVKYSNK